MKPLFDIFNTNIFWKVLVLVFHSILPKGYISHYTAGEYGMFCVLGNTVVQESDIERVKFQYFIQDNDMMLMTNFPALTLKFALPASDNVSATSLSTGVKCPLQL